MLVGDLACFGRQLSLSTMSCVGSDFYYNSSNFRVRARPPTSMEQNQQEIENLEARLDRLVRTQIDFQKEVTAIRAALAELRSPHSESDASTPAPPAQDRRPHSSQPLPSHPVPPEIPPGVGHYVPPPDVQPNTAASSGGYSQQCQAEAATAQAGIFASYAAERKEAARTDLEKFIGENLISKIGVLILIIGVGIGVKFAIDNGWISPMMRVGLAYLVGIVLIGFAAKLKAKYHNFSAVLLSGGIAILYFVTYFAYAYYSLIGQPMAFGVMVLLTVATVAAAIIYDRQVIAHIGLVGAYGVPFLLSNNSGNYLFLFAYMAILNIGILAVSLKKYWKPLFYTSSVFTWVIFAAWLGSKFSAAAHFHLALVFLAIFFAIFYGTKVGHTYLQREEAAKTEDLLSAFGTTFIFYLFCFALISFLGSGAEFTVFFSYLAVISLVILITAYRCFTYKLIYVCYPFTWVIFAVWFADKYRADEHFANASVFSFVFFLLYYVTAFVYRLAVEKISMVENSGLVLTNSFVFYGFGYAILESRENLHQYQGVFTVAHAAFHSLVSQAVSRLRSSAIDVVQVLTVLIITFATIAIPVQFDGNRITLIWAVEAAVLFWFGRVKQIRLFEDFSYPLMALASVSLIINWVTSFSERTEFASGHNLRPFVNGDFVTAIVLVASFAVIYRIDRKNEHGSVLPAEIRSVFQMILPAVALAALYNTFRTEIDNYYNLKIVESRAQLIDAGAFSRNRDLGFFNTLWQIDYSMLFLAILGFINLRRVRSATIAYANVLLAVIAFIAFLAAGMPLFRELRESYMDPDAALFWGSGSMNIVIRYISYLIAAMLMGSLYYYGRDEMLDSFVPRAKRVIAFETLLYTTLLIVLSGDLVNLMTQFGIADANKLGLSILWAAYALFLVIIGIARNKKYLRFAAIGIIGVTLAKLFFYDIADLPTVPKAFLFIAIGVVLLVVSFLYNKYKKLMFPSVDTDGTSEGEI